MHDEAVNIEDDRWTNVQLVRPRIVLGSVLVFCLFVMVRVEEAVAADYSHSNAAFALNIVCLFLVARSRVAAWIYYLAREPNDWREVFRSRRGNHSYPFDNDTRRDARSELLRFLVSHTGQELRSRPSAQQGITNGLRYMSPAIGGQIRTDPSTASIARFLLYLGAADQDGWRRDWFGEFSDVIERTSLFLATNDEYAWDTDRWSSNPTWMRPLVGQSRMRSIACWPFSSPEKFAGAARRCTLVGRF